MKPSEELIEQLQTLLQPWSNNAKVKEIEALLEECKQKDIDLVNIRVLPVPDHYPIIFFPILKNNLALLNLFIKYGAKMNLVDDTPGGHNNTPLQLAERAGASKKIIAAIKVAEIAQGLREPEESFVSWFLGREPANRSTASSSPGNPETGSKPKGPFRK